MNSGLQDKVAIVTGGGRGIGRAIVHALASEGAKIIVNDIHAEVAGSVVDEVKALGAQAIAIVADVTRLDQVDAMVWEGANTFGSIDILVNNVGTAWGDTGPATRSYFITSNQDEWDREWMVVFRGAQNCIKSVLPHMIARNGGSIVNISSLAAEFPIVKQTLYSAGKGALNALTRSLAAEMGQYGIRVNAIAPGLVDASRFTETLSMKETDPDSYRVRTQTRDDLLRLCPLGRAGEPKEIASGVVFLVSDAASYITGHVLNIDGGAPSFLAGNGFDLSKNLRDQKEDHA
jgi:3-oxoacyl-[acyl-carrier protein] reductase